jgi:hypothetical protein
MGRVRFLTVLMVGSALVLLAASAQGQVNYDRPDILDVYDGSSYLYVDDNDTRVEANMYASSTGPWVSGSMSATAQDANNKVEVYTWLFQPDKTSRNHRRAKADQKRYMWVQMALRTVTYGSTIASHSTAIEDCKGSMSADDRDKDGMFDVTPTSDDRIRGKLRCKRDMLEDLGFGPVEIIAIEGIIGNRTKLSIRLPQ